MTTPNEKVWQVKSDRYVGGIVTVDGKVTEAAPVLKWAIGKSFMSLIAYFDRHCIEMTLSHRPEVGELAAGEVDTLYLGDPNDL